MPNGISRLLNKVFNVKVTNSTPIEVTVRSFDEKHANLDKVLKQIHSELRNYRREIETIRFATTREVMNDVGAFHRAQVSSQLESLTRLAQSQASLARFGDGEFRMMLRPDFNLRFQSNSEALRDDLRRTFTSTDENLLVGFPQLFRDAHWSGVYQELWDELRQLLTEDQRFVNAHITRPQTFSLLGQQAVDLWRSIWDGKKVSIVTGEGSRFELVPALFDNLAGSEFIYSQATNAYSDLERLHQLSLEADSDLVLIALGPAGSVLAHRLAASGKRALDIGHLPNSYLNVFEGAGRPESVPVVRRAGGTSS